MKAEHGQKLLVNVHTDSFSTSESGTITLYSGQDPSVVKNLKLNNSGF